jgi:hypothetical protein
MARRLKGVMGVKRVKREKRGAAEVKRRTGLAGGTEAVVVKTNRPQACPSCRSLFDLLCQRTRKKEGEKEDGKKEKGWEKEEEGKKEGKEGGGNMNVRFVSHSLPPPPQHARATQRAAVGATERTAEKAVVVAQVVEVAEEKDKLQHCWHRQHRWCSLQHSTRGIVYVFHHIVYTLYTHPLYTPFIHLYTRYTCIYTHIHITHI